MGGQITAGSTTQIDIHANDRLTGMAITAWVFVFLAFSLDLMDWTLLAFTAPEIIKEFKFSKEEMGVLLGAPLIGAGIGGILSGWLADKIGRVKAMGVCLLWFSVFTVLFPLAPTLPETKKIKTLSEN